MMGMIHIHVLLHEDNHDEYELAKRIKMMIFSMYNDNLELSCHLDIGHDKPRCYMFDVRAMLDPNEQGQHLSTATGMALTMEALGVAYEFTIKVCEEET